MNLTPRLMRGAKRVDLFRLARHLGLRLNATTSTEVLIACIYARTVALQTEDAKLKRAEHGAYRRTA
jgi:hypothetical protein